ncbi:4-hydroxy-tetrahydrodipicolinate synthase [Catenuloplanes atrovinosus]|uniref:4-hydroxy-tetrahydrodipicolinate synthase n=2 Tax=Catenuloplanes atrovinosus TaxID=137266 RepID=A0AAE3YH98_9ACTN|nr:4-hydroxy-tetrahydrodipicolinate synthase [Catenuloplanes atrovinosus]
MVTPFRPDGSLDADGAQKLAAHLVDVQRNDALVLSGTGGESPTTSEAEKETLIRVVREAIGDRARIIAGVGTNDTAHTVELARAAEKAGADGLLVVTPYYNKPPQAGLVRHFTTVAGETGLPVMLYDIPHRSGIPIATETLIRVAEHPNIVAVKDAKSDLIASSTVLASTDLAFYSGEDAGTLPWLSIGAVGVVGTSTHFVGARTQELIAAFERGDVAEALRLHRQLLPIYTGIFRTAGTILVKAGLNAMGLPAGPVRSPLVDATEDETAQLRADCLAAGVTLAA